MPLSQIVSASIEDGAVAPVDLSSVAQYYGFKNRIINGAMGIAQRGTSFTNLGASTPAYGLDRWAAWRGSYTTGLSASQQTGFSGFANCYRFGRAASNASLEPIYTAQIIESVNMLDLAGQTINVSFWGRNGANYSGSSFGVLISIGTATNQTLTPLTVASWTGFSNILNTQPTLTTTGAQYTASVAVPSNAQSMAIQFYYTPTGTAGAADYIEITGVQLEKGVTATSFDYRPYGTEFALCQRYYASFVSLIVDNGSAVYNFPMPVTMRTTPTFTGGGSGFTTVGYTNGNTSGYMVQTTRAVNALVTASAEL